MYNKICKKCKSKRISLTRKSKIWYTSIQIMYWISCLQCLHCYRCEIPSVLRNIFLSLGTATDNCVAISFISFLSIEHVMIWYQFHRISNMISFLWWWWLSIGLLINSIHNWFFLFYQIYVCEMIEFWWHPFALSKGKENGIDTDKIEKMFEFIYNTYNKYS